MSLVPQFEALALPITVERATQKPTPNMFLANTSKLTYPTQDIYCCFGLDCDLNLRDSELPRTKRQVNAFFYVTCSLEMISHNK